MFCTGSIFVEVEDFKGHDKFPKNGQQPPKYTM